MGLSVVKLGESRYTMVSRTGATVDALPNDVYSVGWHREIGFFVEGKYELSVPKTLYHVEQEFIDRVFAKFNSKDSNLGVMMSGKKGTGKSVTSKLICIEALKTMPVIVLTENYEDHGRSALAEFIGSITQPCVIFIDEFDKIYPSNHDDSRDKTQLLLSMLDGVQKSKKLFLLTSNSSWFGEYLVNRPGRVHYHRKYENLPIGLIKEVVKAELKNKEFEKDLMVFCSEVNNMSIDTLMSLVADINLFNVPVKKALQDLNFDLQNEKYKVTISDMETGKEVYVTFMELPPPAFIQKLTGHLSFKDKYMTLEQAKALGQDYGEEEGDEWWDSYIVVNYNDLSFPTKLAEDKYRTTYKNYEIILTKHTLTNVLY